MLRRIHETHDLLQVARRLPGDVLGDKTLGDPGAGERLTADRGASLTDNRAGRGSNRTLRRFRLFGAVGDEAPAGTGVLAADDAGRFDAVRGLLVETLEFVLCD